MPLISGENWPGIAAPIIGIFIVLGLSFGTVRYVEWSSDANLARFTSRTEVAEAASVPILPLRGRTGCAQGSKSPSTLSLPLE